MFGYVRPNAQRLSSNEQERFRAAYCGLCHALGRRCGFAARFVLNYDFTLLAVLLSLGTRAQCTKRRCAAHPCRGCAAMDDTPALDTAADHSVVLMWWQLQDHIADHGFFAGSFYRLAAFFLRRAYRRSSRRIPEFDAAVRLHLRELNELERSRCASLDAAAEPFAALLAEIAATEPDSSHARILRQLFYHLGRWIYLVDAADDFKKDARSGNYNPLRCRFCLDGDELSEDAKQTLGETLDASIRQMASAYALLEPGEWEAVLDSIFYDSLYAIGKAVLSGVYRKRPPKRCGRQTLSGEETNERSL